MHRFWENFIQTLTVLFLPTVSSYHLLTSDLFLGVARTDAEGLEKLGNILLTPCHYLLAAKSAIPKDGSWVFEQKFSYGQDFWVRTTASFSLAPPSLILGSICKGLGFLSQTTRRKHAELFAAQKNTAIESNFHLYNDWGIHIEDLAEVFIPQGFERRPEDQNVLKDAKIALKEIASLLTKAKIPWWVDCGTCLGTYRYGGIIPWDEDIDLGVLAVDFENVRRALNALDPKKYQVQDWSGRCFPNTFFKIYDKKSRALIDIFCFKVDPEKKEISSIFSLDESIFFPEWFKDRERPFTVPAPFSTVFPLKKATFDGIEVFVPNKTKEYLQRLYGENLDPVKIYNPQSGRYEKDLSHPYWLRPNVN